MIPKPSQDSPLMRVFFPKDKAVPLGNERREGRIKITQPNVLVLDTNLPHGLSLDFA